MTSKKICDSESQQHTEKMEQVAESVKKKVADAKEDRGVVIVLTGDGKGKSSSGFGMVLRCLGHGLKVGVVQFIKGKWRTGEQLFCESHEGIEYISMGQGFTWDTKDKEGDIRRAEACWEEVKRFIADETISLVLLDELNVVLEFGYLELDEVLAAIKSKPESKNIVITGRGAPEQLLEVADTVSLIESPKHAFESGIRAQKGVEF